MKTKKLTKYIITLSLGMIVAGAVSVIAAGGPTPPAEEPDTKATMYSLSDIYNRLDNFSNPGPIDDADISTTDEPTSQHYSLSDIYDLLVAAEGTLTADNIKEGETIFGVTGDFTGELEWSDEAPEPLNWDAAENYCANLEEGGATAGDWRLPTISELLAGIADDWIVDDTKNRFASNSAYWSGTELSATTNAWFADWFGGVYGNRDKTNTYSVRCVR